MKTNYISFPDLYKIYSRADKVTGGEARERILALLTAWNEDGDLISWEHAEKALHAAYSGKRVQLETHEEFATAALKVATILDPIRQKTSLFT